MVNFPENIIVLASHGSDAIPEQLAPWLHPDFDPRLRKNFSDHATKDLIRDVPEAQKAIPTAGRIAGDPNRAPNAPDLFRTTDFNGIPLFYDDVPPSIRQHIYEEHVVPFHNRVADLISLPQIRLVIDVHDTGNHIPGVHPWEDRQRGSRPGEWRMPMIVLSDGNGTTADPAETQMVQQHLSHVFGLDKRNVPIDRPYTGGYVTRHVHDVRQSRLPGRPFSSIQLEFNRDLYMDEGTQQIDEVLMADCRTKLMEVLRRVGREFGV